MKKILSLLVLLVTTLSAFALDFTDYRKVTLGSNTPTESNDAKLSITDNGDGTYNVTFNDIINKDGSYTDKYGTFVFVIFKIWLCQPVISVLLQNCLLVKLKRFQRERTCTN